jgi:hypothetical protein
LKEPEALPEATLMDEIETPLKYGQPLQRNSLKASTRRKSSGLEFAGDVYKTIQRILEFPQG